MEHTVRECGCTTATGRSGNPYIVYCPKHSACDDMYEALKIALALLVALDTKGTREVADICQQALAKTRNE